MKYLTVIFVLLFAFSTHAETLTVTRSDDRNATCVLGDCSLREAVNAANGLATDDTISFVAGLSTIELSSVEAGDISIQNNGTLSIEGPGANVLIIDGLKKLRVFYITGATVTISGVTIQNGFCSRCNFTSSSAGGIYVVDGTLALDSVVIRNNDALFVTGGIRFLRGSNHRVTNSTFVGNTALQCAGLYAQSTTLLIENSTISGNIAGRDELATQADAPGICTYSSDKINITTIIRNSTITNNSIVTGVPTGSGGGGLFNDNGVVGISNSIISANIAPRFPDISNYGTIISSGGNLIGNLPDNALFLPVGTTIFHPTDIRGIHPVLGPLQYNGGTTPTHALLEGSPAINAGNNQDTPATDQRGFARLVGGITDIGAYEFVPVKSRKRVRFF